MQGSVLASHLLPEAVLGHSGRGSKNPSKDPKWTVHRVAREHRHGPPPPGPESKPKGKVSRAAGDTVNPSNHLTRGPGFREHLPPSSLGLQGAPQTRPPGQRDTQDPGGQHTRAQSATLLNRKTLSASPVCRRKREAGLPHRAAARAPPGGSCPRARALSDCHTRVRRGWRRAGDPDRRPGLGVFVRLLRVAPPVAGAHLLGLPEADRSFFIGSHPSTGAGALYRMMKGFSLPSTNQKSAFKFRRGGARF